MERHTDRFGMCHQNIGYIRIIDWLNDNHFVAWINKPQYSGKDRFCCACSHNHAPNRINFQVIKTRCVISNSLAQGRCTGSRGILVMLTSMQKMRELLKNLWGSIKIRLALPKIKGLMLLSKLIHLGKNSSAKRGHTLSKARHTRL